MLLLLLCTMRPLALSEIPRSRATADLLFLLISTNLTASRLLFFAITGLLFGHVTLFPGRFVAKAAWEGMREAESQPISWTRPMRWLQQQKLASPSVRACVPSVVLART